MRILFHSTVFLLTIFMFSLHVGAQTENLTIPQIDAKIASLPSDPLLSEAERTEIEQLLSAAKANLSQAKQIGDDITAFEAAVSNATKTIEGIKQELKETKDASNKFVSGKFYSGMSAAEIRNQGPILQSKNSALRAELSASEAKLDALRRRPDEISKELSTVRKQLNDAESNAPIFDDQTLSKLEVARRALEKSTQDKLAVRIDALERELKTVTTRQSISTARIELAKAKISLNELYLEAIQSKMSETLRGEANDFVTEAQLRLAQAKDAPLEMQEMAQVDLVLAQALDTLSSAKSQTQENQRGLIQSIKKIEADERTVVQILDTGALSDELGQILRGLRADLPKASAIMQRIDRVRKAQISNQLNQILWREQIRKSAEAANTSEATDAFRENILSSLIETSEAYGNLLIEVLTLRQELLGKTTSLSSLIDRRLVWLPNSDPLSLKWSTQIVPGVVWLVDPEKWKQVANVIYGSFLSSVGIGLFFILSFGLLIGSRTFFKKRLEYLASKVGKVGTDTFSLTPRALLLSILLALPWPLLVFGFATLLGAASEGPNSFPELLSTALTALSSVMFFLLVPRVMCRKKGLFDAHYGWSNEGRNILRKNLNWFFIVQSITTFFFTLAMSSGNINVENGIGFVAFVIASLGMGVFAYRVFHPRAVSKNKKSPKKKKYGWITKITFPLVVALPILTGITPIFGYFDTAVEIQSKNFMTGLLFVLCAVLYGLAMRHMLVSHRRLALKQALARREEAETKRAEIQTAEASGDAVPNIEIDHGPDLDEMIDQSRTVLFGISMTLFAYGLWTLWSPLVPALGIVDEIVLWQRAVNPETGEVLSVVTLWNLIFGFGVFAVTIHIARNMRGGFAASLFQRLSNNAGTRFAMTTITGYMVFAFGVLFFSHQIGIDWSKLQWIVAALGVGLGFGLQEIVANFISGLIILFERPIRIGDTVTIGSASGTVTRIQIRATTITDWDNREIMLPNKSIITENVSNWTLNNPITRLLLPIGVAYGSDTVLVHKILSDILLETENVLTEPPPSVFFTGFGDSALNFEVRAFVPSTAQRLPVTHALNNAISQKLAEHGIEIPFPQRDLHLKTMPEEYLKKIK